MTDTKENEVVVTGMGIVSCLGNELQAVENSLRSGKSGIVVDEERKALGFRSPLTGKVSFDVKQFLDRKRRKTMDEVTVQAYAAAEAALAQAGLTSDDFSNYRSGIIIGNDSCSRPNVDAADLLRKYKETYQLGSGYIFQVMNSSITMNLSTLFKVKGANWTLAGACASGNHAVGQGYNLIRLGEQDRVITGGAQEISWQSMASFDALGAFSANIASPEKASRPFSADRDGLIPSGGAAVLILERRSCAEKRGAQILAVIKSYVFSADGDHLSIPSGEGAKYCIRESILRAGLEPEQINYINAHATSTPVGDKVEAAAILDVFGQRTPPVSSTKGMTGHECWMSGASELIYSIIMMQSGFLAPNINFTGGDDVTSKLNIVTRTTPAAPRTILSNSSGSCGE